MTKEKAIEILKYNSNVIHKTINGETDPNEVEALDMAIKALEQEPTTKENLAVDLIDRAELLKAMDTWDKFGYLAHDGLIRLGKENKYYVQYVRYEDMVNCVKGMPSVTQQEPRWIPVSEKLPKDLEPVNITWINHDPEPYYNDIKDKPFTATGVYFNGQWYW